MNRKVKETLDYLGVKVMGLNDTFRFHCTMCGKCCLNREDILLNPLDVFKMSKELGVLPARFVKEFCDIYVGENSRIPIVRLAPQGEEKRCPLLNGKKCMVHHAKPTVCAMFPIGRLIAHDLKRNDSESEKKIQYFFSDPNCGDKKEMHTVEGWLMRFGILSEDPFFVKWSDIIMRLSQMFQELEKRINPEQWNQLQTAVGIRLYIDYDQQKDFLPQFEKNIEELSTIERLLFNGED